MNFRTFRVSYINMYIYIYNVMRRILEKSFHMELNTHVMATLNDM